MWKAFAICWEPAWWISPEGLVAASIALVLLIRISAPLTLIAVGSLGCFSVALE
jgi:hypothetical protein